MMNIVCTSKPCDGLLYYSYEYCCYLNSIGVVTDLVIITHPRFDKEDYFDAITNKYSTIKNVIFDDYETSDTTLVLGRSMITLPFIDRESYTIDQLLTLHILFKNKVIAVYSENHTIEYLNALNYFRPNEVIDLCDYDIYPHGNGAHFEKKIWFDIYKPIERNQTFKYLFNGTSKDYYKSARSVISKYKDHGIMIYDIGAIDTRYNNILVPVDNLMGMFDTYVYTKKKTDPAPRLIQECKYFRKEIIFENTNIGAEVYMNRKTEKPNVEAILNVI